MDRQDQNDYCGSNAVRNDCLEWDFQRISAHLYIAVEIAVMLLDSVLSATLVRIMHVFFWLGCLTCLGYIHYGT